MWKRDEAAKTPAARETVPSPGTGAPSGSPPGTAVQRTESPTRLQNERDIVNIGKSVVVKGELNGSEDLTVEGHVEGKIELREHVLTIGPNGRIKAQVFAKTVIVFGEITGNVSATEKVDVRENGSVEGDIVAPRVAIAEGAHFRGTVDMQRTGVKPSSGSRPGSGLSADVKVEVKQPVAVSAAPAEGPRVGL